MSYKRKNVLLLIGFILSIPLLYYTTFKSTIDLKNTYAKLLKEKIETDNITSRTLAFKYEGKYIDSILAKENIFVDNSFQQILLKKINGYKESSKIEIIEFNNPIEVLDNSIKSQLYPITIKGDFNSLLQFLNYFEQEGLGEIKSYSFKKKKDYARRSEYLVLELLLKKVISN
ncbi:hypothetical protein EV195_10946 [Tenacibaculum skagerrakense]|uniref:Uncharacterized protein n=1 Tax=Tenacibaculum skagerrakense TaxID=186571 RepID=A0A4R2NNX6_9FLAO|nr:hypothetical protein [Tenacibaculum skagerrakense]TCP23322.1 hypothetical protein EV195_10946 [Tenacibaculum skagerrakense]